MTSVWSPPTRQVKLTLKARNLKWSSLGSTQPKPESGNLPHIEIKTLWPTPRSFFSKGSDISQQSYFIYHWWEKIKGSKRWRHFFFCLDPSFSFPSLNIKVPAAQMASLLFTLAPFDISPSSWFKAFSTLMTPKFIPPASLWNSSLRYPVSSLTSDFNVELTRPTSLL